MAPPPLGRPLGRVTVRGVVLGTALAAAHTAWVVYDETAWGHLGTSITGASLLASAVALLFVLLAANGLLSGRMERFRLKPPEMMVIFTMVTVSAMVAGFDLLQNLMPTLLMPFWYATPANRWERFLPNIAPWLAPRDPAVVRAFFLGGGSFFEARVWHAWLVPLLAWGGFLFVLCGVMFCLNVLMRRQWVDRERLPFPILEVPLTMVSSGTLGGLFSRRTLLLGFAIPVAVESLNVLSGMFPSLPGVQLNLWNLGHFITEPPYNAANPLYMMWQPFGIGLAFLIPLDVSFSCWFFYLARKAFEVLWVSQGWGAAGGAGAAFPYTRELAYGAWLGLFVTLMWSARSHLRSLLGLLMPRRGRAPEDAGEAISYRLAAAGVLAGYAALVGFAVAAGMSALLATVYFMLFLLATVAMTRVYAQVGMPVLELYFFNTEAAIVAAAGSRSLTAGDQVVMTNFFWFNRCYRQHPMAHQLEAMRFSDLTGTSRRWTAGVLPLAALIGIVVGFLATLEIYYTRGAGTAKVLGYQLGVGWEAYGRLQGWADAPQAPQAKAYIAAGSSFAVVGGLALLRGAILGCPLHPIGYALAVSYAMEYFWAPFFATWLLKLLIVRYGGLKAYRNAMPFFLGFVIGDYVTVIFWGLVASAFGLKGISPYLFHKW